LLAFDKEKEGGGTFHKQFKENDNKQLTYSSNCAALGDISSNPSQAAVKPKAYFSDYGLNTYLWQTS
jgi:hypothetical protein